MSNKNYDSSGSEGYEGKEYQNRSILSKFDYDLFKEEENFVERVIRVKRTQLANKSEKWRILADGKVVFTIEGAKISKKEKEFLRTLEGFKFLIEQYKEGISSLAKLRGEMKKKIK